MTSLLSLKITFIISDIEVAKFLILPCFPLVHVRKLLSQIWIGLDGNICFY